LSGPGKSEPVDWNDPGLKDFPEITLFINCTCPEPIITAVRHTITLMVTIVSLNDANNATHADITLQWSWSRIGADTPSYQSSEYTFPNRIVGQNCTCVEELYIRAVDVGILPGQSGYNFLMLKYTIGLRVYSGTDVIFQGGCELSQNIPVTAGADANETLLSLLPIIALGTGIVGASIAALYYLRKTEKK
jgi:hypothetical protein